MTQVQEESNSTETHLSGCARERTKQQMLEINNQSINIRGFELESDEFGNSWAEKTTYVHKSMAADISPKDIKDKKISLHPVSNNIKDSRKLDEFTKELVVEKKN